MVPRSISHSRRRHAEVAPSALAALGVRTALAQYASEATGLSGYAGTKEYRGSALFELAQTSWRGRGCSRWSCTDGFATPAMWKG
jgi:hypothetical protein